VVNPASTNGRTASTCAATSGPHANASAMSSGRTNWLAAANAAGPGSSALTFQPPANQRNWSWARATASLGSEPHEIGQQPIFGRRTPAASSKPRTSSGSGSTATIASADGANASTDCAPETATATGTPPSGTSQSLAESTRKCRPTRLTYSPANSSPMISNASVNISCRTFAGGHPWPTTCSLRFSPAPSPSVNRPSPASSATVAACWATTVGW